LDDETLKRARIRALEEGTSVNAVLRAFLEDYTGGSDHRRAAGDAFLRISEEYEAGSGPEGRTWSRDELYERG
jgi:plasmid stability protein